MNTKTVTEDASALETKEINPQSLAESKIEESNPTDSLSASLQDGTTISISRDTVGATGDTSNVTIRVVYHNVKLGDRYTITIPKATVYGLVNADGQKLQVLGSTDIKDLAGETQIVNNFNKESVTGSLASQIFELAMVNNYVAQPVPMNDIGETLKSITIDKVSRDGTEDSASVTLKQIIAPEMAQLFLVLYQVAIMKFILTLTILMNLI